MGQSPLATAYPQTVFAYRKSGAALPQITTCTVYFMQDVAAEDSTFSGNAFSIQLNVTGKKYWSQVVLQKFGTVDSNNTGAHFNLEQYRLGTSTPNVPDFYGGAEYDGDFPVHAGVVCEFDVKDDGQSLWGYLSVWDPLTDKEFETGWVKFGIYDEVMAVSLILAGAGGGSHAAFTSGFFVDMVQTYSTSAPDLTKYVVYADWHSPFGQPLPPWEIPAGIVPSESLPFFLGMSAETSNLYCLITNSNEMTPVRPLAGYQATHSGIVS